MNRHTAPSVVYPVSISAVPGIALLFLWASGFAGILLWWHGVQRFDWRIAVGLGAALVGAIASQWWLKKLVPGQLFWDGQVWRWKDAADVSASRDAEQKLALICDFQHCLLVRLESQTGRKRWLYLERRAMPQRWIEVRRAVYSPRKGTAGLLPDSDEGIGLDKQPLSGTTGSPALQVAKDPQVIHEH